MATRDPVDCGGRLATNITGTEKCAANLEKL